MQEKKAREHAVQPIEDTNFTLYVLDERISCLNFGLFKAIFPLSSALPYMCISFNEKDDDYHIIENGTGLSPLKIIELDLKTRAKQCKTLKTRQLSIQELNEYVQGYLEQLQVILGKKRMVVDLQLVCPPNLGRPNEQTISADFSHFISQLAPKKLIFVFEGRAYHPTQTIEDEYEIDFGVCLAHESLISSASITSPDQILYQKEMNNYLNRKPTQYGYTPPDTLMCGAWLAFGDLQAHLAASHDTQMTSIEMLHKLRSLPHRISHTSIPLTLYILSPRYLDKDGYVTTVLSTTSYEQSLVFLYDSITQTYDFIQPNIIPLGHKQRTPNTLISIDRPLHPMTQVHFIQYVQLLKGRLGFGRVRLVIEPTFHSDVTEHHVSHEVNEVIHMFKPDHLYIISAENEMDDVRHYLNRTASYSGFMLPNKTMKGYFIPATLFTNLLDSISQKDEACACRVPHEHLVAQIRHYFDRNLIPDRDHELQSDKSMSPRYQLSASNKAGTLFKPQVEPKSDLQVRINEPPPKEDDWAILQDSNCCSMM